MDKIDFEYVFAYQRGQSNDWLLYGKHGDSIIVHVLDDYEFSENNDKISNFKFHKKIRLYLRPDYTWHNIKYNMSGKLLDEDGVYFENIHVAILNDIKCTILPAPFCNDFSAYLDNNLKYINTL